MVGRGSASVNACDGLCRDVVEGRILEVQGGALHGGRRTSDSHRGSGYTPSI